MYEKNIFIIDSICFNPVFIAGCGSKSDDKTSQVNVFFNAAKDAGPIFAPDRSKITKAAWGDITGGLGKPIYEIFLMFRDYDPALDTGPGSSVGLNNIYTFIYQAGQFFNECDSDGTSVTATAFTSPFNFGRSDTYNKYLVQVNSENTRGNYFASKKEGGIDYGLLCWYIDYGASNNYGKEHGIMQGYYNETTGEINIDLICFVEYKTGGELGHSKMSMRTHLEGNATTHTFDKLLCGRWNHGDSDSDLGTPDIDGYIGWYLGSGVAKGAGAKFVFKVGDNGDLITSRYFIFPADADEDTLKSLSDAGDDGLGAEYSVAPISTYKATIDTLTNYSVSTPPVDVPDNESDFGGTGLGNMKPVDMP